MAAVERLSVLHHSADYMFISLRIIRPIVVSLKMEVCSLLESISSVANFITAYEESQ